MSEMGIIYGPTNFGDWYLYNDTFFDYYHRLDDADDKIGFGMTLTEDGTFTEVGFNVIHIIGTPPTDYQLGVVTIEYDDYYDEGLPSDNLYSNATWQNYDPVTVGSGWNWITLDTSIVATAGSKIAIVIKPGSTVPDASNYVGIMGDNLWYGTYPQMYRYTTYWSTDNGPGQAALKYSDGRFAGYPILDLCSQTTHSPEELGLEFTLPMKATCIGAAVIHQESYYGIDTPYSLRLTDGNDTILTKDDVTYPSFYSYAGDSWPVYHKWKGVELDANTTYRLILKPTSLQYVMTIGFEMLTESAKEVFPGGTEWKWIYRPTPASGWVATPEKYPWMSLILTNIGGSVINNSYGFIG